MDVKGVPGGFDDHSRFEVMDEKIKSEVTNSPHLQPSDHPRLASKSPSHPIPTTETSEPSPMAATGPVKKKGTAVVKKKGPKRPNGNDRARTKKAKTDSSGPASAEASADEESDNGPYCICRGPDGHRWMICCEKCEDWFHGECINIDKSIGEALIEKFICPNCSDDNQSTIYKRTCALGGCRKAARLAQESVFCSNEHAQTWWERLVAKLPKPGAKSGLSDQLTQDEFMALLGSGLSGFDEQGKWRLAPPPFKGELAGKQKDAADDDPAQKLSAEENEVLEGKARMRFQLAEETMLCHKMLTLIEYVQARRRAAIDAGRIGEDVCGYDWRLDVVSARDAFAAFAKSPEGDAIFEAGQIGDPLGEGDEIRGMCERKRCKPHGGWQKLLALGIKHHIKVLAAEAADVAEEERMLREAAVERNRRKQAEKNWVEVVG
ncbi:hypothetical protein B0I35DRAFT_260607 [Stachybotrys elegans]|uniref:PHD-type domain-containing protein n=1 Tax=Stachybotrys elegans TaxID=80388 RepID=A0A8K0SQT9_9HYPO|nr:hypothetical protein B0I35DRAFT_260607 [Stachybotrys elegans]